MYNVGQITRDLQADYLTPDGRLTPRHLGPLVAGLAQMTDSIQGEALRLQLGGFPWLTANALPEQWNSDMRSWQERLAAYKAALASASPNDRKAILWTVTAPLLLGFYGGPDSEKPQSVLDAVTPYMLANQLEIEDEYRETIWNQFKEDVKTEAKSTGLDLLSVLKWTAAGLVGLWIVDKAVD